MSMDNLIQYSDNYSKNAGSLWQYYRDEPALNDAGIIIDFPNADIDSASFNFKQKITNQTKIDGKRMLK